MITLQDISRIKVDFPLPERYSGEVRTGQKFTFTVAGNGQVFEGVVTVLEPAIDAATRSLLVRGMCAAPQGLQPGGFAEVTLTLDGLANGFLVPSQAIVPSARGQGVYLIENGRAKLQPVEIGIRTDDRVQILRGVKEGDVVATTNLLRIRPGLEVTAARSTMSLSETSIRRPVLATVMSLVIVLFGIIGFHFLGVREYPAVDPPIVTVQTTYPGANPDVIASQITEPLEQVINGIAGIRTITSESRDERSTITVEFTLDSDLSDAANDVRDRVSRAIRDLPDDANPPVVEKADADSSPILFYHSSATTAASWK